MSNLTMSEIDQRIIDTRRRATAATQEGNKRRASALRGVITRLRNQRDRLPLAWPVARNEEDAERMAEVEAMAPGFQRTRAHKDVSFAIAHGTQRDVDDYAARVHAAIKDLRAEGPYVVTHGDGYHDGSSTWPREGDDDARRWFAFEAPEDVRIVLQIGTAESWSWRDGTGPKVEVTGHTLYKLGAHWFNFTRRGIDCGSFDHTEADDPWLIVEAQATRARDKRDRLEKMVPVPGLPGLSPRIPEARIATDRATIEAGGAVTFRPGGFGTGYHVTRRRPRGRFGYQAAPEALCVFYGFESLWLERMDCD